MYFQTPYVCYLCGRHGEGSHVCVQSDLVNRNQELLSQLSVAKEALEGFRGLLEAYNDSYGDSVVIRCEVTAKDLWRLKNALDAMSLK